MAIKVAIINGKEPSAGVGGVSDADLSAAIVDFINPGAVAADALQVTPPGGTAKEVIIKAGRYYAANATGSMVYVVDLDTDYTLAIPDNGSANPRIDAIVLKIDLGTTPNNFADNIASFVDVQGTPAVSPTVPDTATIQSTVGSGNVAVKLGEVTASAGFTTITSGNIADTRTTANLSIETITDSNGNEQLKFSSVASAVNELTVGNAASGSAPSLSATGNDTNIDVRLNPKGTGNVKRGASGGAIDWWEEIGRTTLGVAGDTITVSNLPARKYLQIRIHALSSGSADFALRFNNDSGNNYAWRISSEGGAEVTGVNNNFIACHTAQTDLDSFIVFDVVNVAGNVKLVQSGSNVREAGATAGTAPGRREIVGKWVNTVSAISRVDVFNGSSGNLDVGSEVVVLGHD